MNIRRILVASCLAGCVSSPCLASVGPDRAARLQTTLTPLGAERAGNAAGTVPEWSGSGNDVAVAEDSSPLYIVTRQSAGPYAANLSDGQRALLQALPEDYGLPVYLSHRRAGAPPSFYAGTLQNATHAFIDDTSPVPQAAVAGIPFPILSSQRPADAGLEAIWNHRLRWRGTARTRRLMQITASTRGDLGVTRVLQRERFQAIDTPMTDRRDAILTFLLRAVIEPRRLAGTVKLSYDPLRGEPVAWQRSPNQPRIQKTQSTGNDTPVIGAEGLFNEDQSEGFSGASSRYDWKLIGTREMLVPYDAAAFEGAAPDDIFGPRNIRPGLAHYELHRVQVVEARLKPTLSSPFVRRVFYLDEDSWQVLLVDLYDRTDRLVRVQEVHTRVGPEGQLVPTLEVVYDLTGKRYFAAATTNRDGRIEFTDDGEDPFQSGRVERWARHAGIVPPEDNGAW